MELRYGEVRETRGRQSEAEFNELRNYCYLNLVDGEGKAELAQFSFAGRMVETTKGEVINYHVSDVNVYSDSVHFHH